MSLLNTQNKTKQKTIKWAVLFLCLVILLVVGARALFFAAFKWYYPIGSTSGAAIRFDSHIIRDYIINNNGNFPESEQELIDRGYLRKRETDGTFEYSFRGSKPNILNPQGIYYQEYWFKYLKVNYGIDPDNLEERNGKLFDKKTGNQVLLIDGPHKWRLQPTYERLSLRWYKSMFEEREKQKE